MINLYCNHLVLVCLAVWIVVYVNSLKSIIQFFSHLDSTNETRRAVHDPWQSRPSHGSNHDKKEDKMGMVYKVVGCCTNQHTQPFPLPDFTQSCA